METSIIVAVIVGLVQVAKKTGLQTRYAPLLAIVLGVGSSFLVGEHASVGMLVFAGLVHGLTAAGLYSGVKASFK